MQVDLFYCIQVTSLFVSVNAMDNEQSLCCMPVAPHASVNKVSVVYLTHSTYSTVVCLYKPHSMQIQKSIYNTEPGSEWHADPSSDHANAKNKKVMSACSGQQRREDAGVEGIRGMGTSGWVGVSLSGRCPAAVTRCKPPIKAGLNPLALFPGGSVMEGPFCRSPLQMVQGTVLRVQSPC